MEHKWTLESICTNEIHCINKSVFRLGRTREHEIVCGSVVISRDHANFSLEGDKLLLKDLNSSNGTFINGKKIQEVECLQNGDIVSFGYSSHSTPCAEHGCFVYQVKDSTTGNSIMDIIGLLEDSTKSEAPIIETELIETNRDKDSISKTKSELPSTSKVIETELIETNRVEDSISKTTSELPSTSKVIETELIETNRDKDSISKTKSERPSTSKVMNVKIEPVLEQNENQAEGVYSIEDNIIVINDDFNEISELSASQLFPANDPYMDIKKELSEYDYVNERLPVVVDSDDSDFDIFDILTDAPGAEHSNIPTSNETELLGKDEVAFNHIDFNEEQIVNTAHSNSKGSIESSNKKNSKELIVESIDSSAVSNLHLQSIASTSSGSKYMKPPIIDAHLLVKPSRSTRSKSNEDKKPNKRSTSADETQNNKKPKTLNNYEPQPSTSSIITRTSKNDSLSTEKKVNIKEERKQKLKKISKQKTDSEAKPSRRSSPALNSKPCVKVSKNRGEFMLNDTPPSLNTRKRSVNVDQNLSKLPKIKKIMTSTLTTESNRETSVQITSLSDLASTSKTQPNRDTSVRATSLSDPRLRKRNVADNTSSSNNPQFKNKQLALSNGRNKESNHLVNNNSVRNGFHTKNYIEISMQLCNKVPHIHNNSSFSDILNILNWRTQWLGEQKASSKCPPVNKRTAVKMCNSFSKHSDYCNVLIPLLTIELWNELFEDWISITTEKQNQRKFCCIIEEVEVEHHYFSLKCTAYITKQQSMTKQYVKDDTIVIVNVPMEKNGTFLCQTLFGFVNSCEKRLIKGNDFVDSYLSKQLKPNVPQLILNLDILIKVTSDKICLNKYMEGARLLSLVSLRREFDAVHNLGLSPLSKFILDPKVKDFIILHNAIRNGATLENLNDVQKKVVQEATQLCLSDTPGIYLVQGPPGTGKTTVIKNIVRNVVFTSNKKLRLLLTAPSNSAVDNLAIKIIRELKARLSDDEKKRIKLIRVGPYTSVNEEVRPYLLDSFSKEYVTRTFLSEHPEVKRDYNTLIGKRDILKAQIEKTEGSNVDGLKEKLTEVLNEIECFAQNYVKQDYQNLLDNAKRILYDGCNIICTTLSSCVRLKELNKNTTIDCCIVDEATQSKETETLIPLMLGITKLVLVGDPKQLPAVTTSQQAKQLEYGQSLFQRIKKNFVDESVNPIRMLNVQHRMHPEISLFPSNSFYKGELKNSKNYHRRQDFCKILPYYVFNLKPHYNQENVQNTNTEEIQCIQKLIEAVNSIIMSTRQPQRVSIGIIAPYNAQKVALSQMINSSSFRPEIEVTVNTVDSFQGLEKDIIILSCVRYRPNIFLSDEQRLNVALTRAKHVLYIVGTNSLFKNCTLLNGLKMDAERRKLYSSINKVSTKVLTNIIRCR